MDNINWDKLKKEDLYDVSLYEKIFSVSNVLKRNKMKANLLDIAKKFRIKSIVEKTYIDYEKEYILEKQLSSTIDFGENAPIKTMIAPNYYKDKMGYIRTFDKNLPVTSTLLQPVAIFKNIETGEELVKCAFLNRFGTKWSYFVISRETILHNGKITKLANKGIDVTSDSSKLLVAYIRTLLNNNDIPQLQSTSKMGWHNGSFLPYDKTIEFDGEENFKVAFESLSTKGEYSTWFETVSNIRKNNVPVKLVMAASFASPLLYLLHKQSFVFLIWGTSGDGKTVAARMAMSVWGDSEKGKLMFSMDSTTNFYYRVADFFNHIPVFFDELQTFEGDINKLIMMLTENIDRGKAKIDGGTEKTKTWNNTFILTGEESASSATSGTGTLNRLIEIYTEKKIIEDGNEVCDILNNNYGFAGKIFIDYIKKIDLKDLKIMFKEKLNQIMQYNYTEEKQANNMALLLLANDLACQCIFKDEYSLEAKNVLKYLFSKDEISKSQRAYKTFIDECTINRTKFYYHDESNNNQNAYGEFWGVRNEYEITIISKKLREILEGNGYRYKQTIQDWAKKGLVEKSSNGKYSVNLCKNGIKANYTTVKIVIENEKNNNNFIDLMNKNNINVKVV